MSLKAKLATTLAALCMVICLLTVGVWAASQTTVNVSGSVSFDATDVWAKVTATSTGAVETINKSVTFNAGVTESGDITNGDTATWDDLNVTFKDTKEDIIITLTVTNLHEENKITAKVKDTSTHTSDANNNVKITIQESAEGGDTLNKVGGTTVSKEYTITLHMLDKNKSVASTAFSVKVTLDNAGADV